MANRSAYSAATVADRSAYSATTVADRSAYSAALRFARRASKQQRKSKKKKVKLNIFFFTFGEKAVFFWSLFFIPLTTIFGCFKDMLIKNDRFWSFSKHLTTNKLSKKKVKHKKKLVNALKKIK